MDPVGPWSAYASYNRLAGVQAGAGSGDFHHHTGLAGHNPGGGVPSTTSQLLLQAAHTTASLAGQLGSSTPSPFNPGGFLSPPAVGYDHVFSPLFHHANPKPAHYSSTINTQHRQALAQAQAAATKQATAESELSTLRENYSHHQTLAAAQGSTFFDQSAAPGAASSLAWQGNNQLPSPFGILPHESVVPSSPSPATTKSSAASYETFNAHFAAAQTLNNHLSSQIANANKAARSASPQVPPPVKPVASQASAPFFQTPTTFGSSAENISSYSTTNAKAGQISSQQDYTAAGKQRANSIAQTPAASSQQSSAANQQDPKTGEKKLNVPVSGTGTGFMASYLKFLQGERDTSPPPATRGGRKATWSRTNTNNANANANPNANANTNNKAFNAQNDHNAKAVDHPNAQTQQQTSNGGMNSTGVINSGGVLGGVGVLSSTSAHLGTHLPHPGAIASTGLPRVDSMIPPLGSVQKSLDPQEDSRYRRFDDRKRKYDGTEESYDANEDDRRLNKPVLNVPSTPLNEKGKKGRGGGKAGPPPAPAPVPQAPHPPPPAAPKKPRPALQAPLPPMQVQPQQQYFYQQPDEAFGAPEAPERRETSHRKARDRLVTQWITSDCAEPADYPDSDSDPVWTPDFKGEGQMGKVPVGAYADADPDIGRSKKLKRCRPMGAGTPSANPAMSNILFAAAHGAGIDYADYSSEEDSVATKKLNQHRTIQHTTPQDSRIIEEMPYQPGDFVAIKSELNEIWPAIWRVDGKTLLQKFEPFDQNGKVLYRNISTYAAWNPENKKSYNLVPVRLRAQNQLETIVELMRNELTMDDNDFIEKRVEETIGYQDNFEVYVQTLISHALDPNFLTEIFQEQDEYFLTNVKAVDDVTEERRRRVAGSGWSRPLEAALATWPCLSAAELGAASAPATCAACRQQRAHQRLHLYGQPYNPATLEVCQPDPRIAYEKEILVCRPCAGRAKLYSRVAHQKYLMFVECNKRVSDKRLQDPHKDTTVILNELLADEAWLSQLFRDVRHSWAEAESVERKSRQPMTRPNM